MSRNNKGMSLLELVIAIAILGIVSAILVSFMSTGSSMFRQVSTDISLQMDSQVAMAQLREYVIDCNDTLHYDDAMRTLTITNSGPEEHKFVWDPADGIIRYNGDPLTEHVAGFRVFEVDGAVEIMLSYEHLGESYFSTQTVALRNDTVTIKVS